MHKRKLPVWFSKKPPKVEEEESKNVNETDDNPVEPPQRILRSQNNQLGRSLRSTSYQGNYDEDVILDKWKPIEYPPIIFNGKINYFTTMIDIAFASDQLLKWLNEQQDDVVPVAFDMEWPFSFKTGPGKSAVIQLCTNTELCYVFHLTNLKKLPVALLELLTHPKIRTHGVNIKNDFRKLERDYPEAKSQDMIDRCIDLGVWCNSVLDTSGRWSLERLVKQICELQIDKSKKIRMSQWHVIPLNEDQKMYAAIDVYISQIIYQKLEKQDLEKQEKRAKFIADYGEEAMKALDKLQ